MTVSTPWLIDPIEFNHLEPQRHWRVVEIGDEQQYLRGHIPGALFLPWQALMHQGPPSPGLLPQIEQLDQILHFLQHHNDVHYWIYDQEGGGWAGRFMWLLEVLGHGRKTYINGGKLAWQAEALPCAQGPEPRMSSADDQHSTQAATIANPQELLSAEELMALLDDDDPPLIWDARSAGEYHGFMRSAARNGHMPGAIHCEWTELMDNAKGSRIRNDAKQYLENKGLLAGAPIVTHCQSHHRSGFTYLVGKSLGLNIRAYAGAWSEWGNRPDTPIISE